jgi:hypothetical protein
MATSVGELETTEIVSQTEPCLNCGTVLMGEHCHSCGQKRVHRHEFGIRHFFSHVLHEITHLDSNKILKTLHALLLKPGQLTADYLAGRKGRHINPLRIYLTFSAIYFLFAWGALTNIRSGGVRDPRLQRAITVMAQKKGVDAQAFGDKLYQKAEKYSAVLRFASVLVSGLLLTLLYYGSGRYYVEHMIFSLHYYSFDFFCKSVFALLFIISGAAGLKLPAQALNFFYPVALIYLIYALRRVYGQPWPLTLLKSVVLFVCETLVFMAVNMVGFIIAFSFA